MGQNVKEIEMRAAEVPGGGGWVENVRDIIKELNMSWGLGFFFLFVG